MEDLTKSDESEFAEEVFISPVRIAVVAHKENDWFQESELLQTQIIRINSSLFLLQDKRNG